MLSMTEAKFRQTFLLMNIPKVIFRTISYYDLVLGLLFKFLKSTRQLQDRSGKCQTIKKNNWIELFTAKSKKNNE